MGCSTLQSMYALQSSVFLSKIAHLFRNKSDGTKSLVCGKNWKGADIETVFVETRFCD